MFALQWLCADPINVPDLTSYILSQVPKLKTRSRNSLELERTRISVSGNSSTVPEISQFEVFPIEILQQIASHLPLQPVLSLRLVSKTLASRLPLDEPFWFQRLLSGSLVPYVWDLDSQDCYAKQGLGTLSGQARESANDSQWDWKSIAKRLLKPNAALMADENMADAPIGLRNRCRIWRMVEEAMALQDL